MTTAKKQASKSTIPADLRDRMLAMTRRGTNLDPNGDPRDWDDTLEARKEKAAAHARTMYARERGQ